MYIQAMCGDLQPPHTIMSERGSPGRLSCATLKRHQLWHPIVLHLQPPFCSMPTKAWLSCRLVCMYAGP